VCLAGLCLAAPVSARAQARAGAWEISGGGVFVGGYDFADRTAELTPNTGTTGTPFELFTTDSTVKPAFGLRARVGFFVTSALAVEGGLRLTRPVYEVRISDDAESAADATAEETLSQYLFDASMVWHFGSSGAGGRTVPFVYGGAGYLRELHEEETLVEEGVELHAGGGMKWWFGSRRRVGIRGEVGISVRDGGFDFEEKRRIVPEAGASVVWVF
jgi:hypothetical protein